MNCQISGCKESAIRIVEIPYFMRAIVLVALIFVCGKHLNIEKRNDHKTD